MTAKASHKGVSLPKNIKKYPVAILIERGNQSTHTLPLLLAVVVSVESKKTTLIAGGGSRNLSWRKGGGVGFSIGPQK